LVIAFSSSGNFDTRMAMPVLVGREMPVLSVVKMRTSTMARSWYSPRRTWTASPPRLRQNFAHVIGVVSEIDDRRVIC
jgi:hypothetical protein